METINEKIKKKPSHFSVEEKTKEAGDVFEFDMKITKEEDNGERTYFLNLNCKGDRADINKVIDLLLSTAKKLSQNT